jgi:rhodanese-related sulfurtransferase
MSILSNLFSRTEDTSNLDAASFEKLIHEDKNAIILDVRTEQENSELRIQKSILIDIYKSDFLNKIEKLDRTKTYLVYCRSGSRSFAACKQMKQLGFEKVYNLKSGINGWNGRVEQG